MNDSDTIETVSDGFPAVRETNVVDISSRLKQRNGRSVSTHIIIPLIFLTVVLLGGIRLDAPDSAFLFLTPPLICLVFASVLMILFFRSGLLQLDGWFSDRYSMLQNAANGVVLLTIFAASTQLFNALLPEQGLTFWVVGFCFVWTLWNNLFADFDTKKLLRSLGALFGMAFVVKYLVLANLTATGDTSLLQRIFADPTKEAFTWLLDLPRYSAGTGYIQFFTLALYLIGLFLTPQSTKE